MNLKRAGWGALFVVLVVLLMRENEKKNFALGQLRLLRHDATSQGIEKENLALELETRIGDLERELRNLHLAREEDAKLAGEKLKETALNHQAVLEEKHREMALSRERFLEDKERLTALLKEKNAQIEVLTSSLKEAAANIDRLTKSRGAYETRTLELEGQLSALDERVRKLQSQKARLAALVKKDQTEKVLLD